MVSIITPAYNCSRFIADTIRSVQAQTYKDWEMLIQDDSSTDNTRIVVEQFAATDPRIKYERNTKNCGAAITRNNAIKRSQGAFLAFLDADDMWKPEKLEHQLQWMEENKVDFSFTEYEHLSEDGHSLGYMAKVVKKLTYRGLMRHCWPGCLTVIYRQDLNHKIYTPDIPKNNDQALFLRVLHDGEQRQGINGKYKAAGMPECLAYYRIRSGSISRNKLKMVKPYIRVLHEFEGQPLWLSYYYTMTHAIIKALFKYKNI